MNELYLSSEGFRELSTNFWRHEFIKRNRPDTHSLNIEMISEWFNRLVLSYLTTPTKLYNSKAELNDLFNTMVKPALIHLQPKNIK